MADLAGGTERNSTHVAGDEGVPAARERSERLPAGGNTKKAGKGASSKKTSNSFEYNKHHEHVRIPWKGQAGSTAVMCASSSAAVAFAYFAQQKKSLFMIAALHPEARVETADCFVILVHQSHSAAFTDIADCVRRVAEKRYAKSADALDDLSELRAQALGAGGAFWRIPVPAGAAARPAVLWSHICATQPAILAAMRECPAARNFAAFASFRPRLTMSVAATLPARSALSTEDRVKLEALTKQREDLRLRLSAAAAETAASSHTAAPVATADELVRIDALLQRERDTMHPADRESFRRALAEFSQTLVAEPERFLYDLIQNVDDCKFDDHAVVPELVIDVQQRKATTGDGSIGEQRVVLTSNELGFSGDDVVALCSLFQSTKQQHSGQTTGYKGVGFKCVFAVSQHVTVQSRGIAFDLRVEGSLDHDPFAYVTPRPPTDPKTCERFADGTRLTVRIAQPREELLERVRALVDVPAMMLWTRRLRRIELRHNGATVLSLSREGPTRVLRAVGSAGGTTLDFDVRSKDDVSIARLHGGAVERAQLPNYIFSGMPVLPLALPYSINSAAFEVALSREELVENDANAQLMQAAHKLWLDAFGTCDDEQGAATYEAAVYEQLARSRALSMRSVSFSVLDSTACSRLGLPLSEHCTLRDAYECLPLDQFDQLRGAVAPAELTKLTVWRLLDHLALDTHTALQHSEATMQLDSKRDLALFATMDPLLLQDAADRLFQSTFTTPSGSPQTTVLSRAVLIECTDGALRPLMEAQLPSVFTAPLLLVGDGGEAAPSPSAARLPTACTPLLQVRIEALLAANGAQLPQQAIAPLEIKRLRRFCKEAESGAEAATLKEAAVQVATCLSARELSRGWLPAALREVHAKTLLTGRPMPHTWSLLVDALNKAPEPPSAEIPRYGRGRSGQREGHGQGGLFTRRDAARDQHRITYVVNLGTVEDLDNFHA